MPRQVSQKWKCPYGFRRVMNLSVCKEEHWMLTAQRVHRESGNTPDQSTITAVLDLPKVTGPDSRDTMSIHYSLCNPKTNSKIFKEGMKKKKIGIQTFKPKAILIPAEGRTLSATALEESLRSH